MDDPVAYQTNKGFILCEGCNEWNCLQGMCGAKALTSTEINDIMWNLGRVDCDSCGVNIDKLVWSPNA
jgi:hypothetical protein